MIAILAQAEGRTLPVTLTLSRAHKTNERIGAKLNEFRAAISRLGQATTLQAYTGEQQATLIRGNAEKAMALSITCVRLIEAQANLRAAVGRANAAAGISDALAQVERNKKLIALCDTYLGLEPSAGALAVDDLAKRAPGEKLSDYPGVAVTGIDATQLRQYAESRAKLESENYALQDALADLNAAKVTFQVSEELFEMLRLKPDTQAQA